MDMTEKYTVVYSKGYTTGSHRNYITFFKRIETSNLDNWLEENEEGIDYSNILFIFEGHSKELGEFNEEVCETND